MLKIDLERVYNYIKKCLDKGYSPSVREICADLDIASTSTAARYINTLVAEGYLVKDNDKQRSLRLAGAQPMRVPVLEDVTENKVISYAAYLSGTSSDDDIFAVVMPDDALRTMGIWSGDIIIAVRRDYVAKGDIVVAITDDRTVVRRFVSTAVGYGLSGIDDLIPTDRCRIIGKVIQIIRNIE